MNKNKLSGGRAHPAFSSLLHKQVTLTKLQCDLVINYHAYLKGHIPERRLFWYMCRKSTWKDKDTGNVLLPNPTLARFMGSSPGNCKTEELLCSMRNNVTPSFTWKEYYAQGYKCRQATHTGVYFAWSEMVADFETKNYYLDTFEERSDRQLQDIVRSLKKNARTFHYPYADQQKVADYLHRLPLRIFTEPLKEHYSTACKAAFLRDDGFTSLSTLLSIKDMPFPFYYTSTKESSITPRIFGKGVPLLPKAIRKLLFPEWIDLDLKNCQIAIIAAILGIADVQQFLTTGQSIWESILDFMQLAGEGRILAKPVLKTGTYSLTYGMHPANVEGNITTGLANLAIEKHKKFLVHPLLKSISLAVTLAKEKIIREKGMQGAYGWMPYAKGDLNSFLACVVQSYELSLISACYTVSTSNTNRLHECFYITLQQHDGICLLMKEETKKEAVIKALKDAVYDKALLYHINTTLEV